MYGVHVRRYSDSGILSRVDTLFDGWRVTLHGDGVDADSWVSSRASFVMYIRGQSRYSYLDGENRLNFACPVSHTVTLANVTLNVAFNVAHLIQFIVFNPYNIDRAKPIINYLTVPSISHSVASTE